MHRYKIQRQELSFQTSVAIFKRERVLNRIFNCNFGYRATPTFVGGAMLVLIFLISTIIRNFRTAPLPILLNCSIGSLGIIYGVKYIVGDGAHVWKDSVLSKKLLNLRANNKAGNMKSRSWEIDRYTVDSCTELRVCIGNFAFATSCTFLVVLEKVLSQTLTLLLTTSSKA